MMGDTGQARWLRGPGAWGLSAMASRILLAFLVLAATGLPVQPARAQGFFQQFFGSQQLPLPPPRPYPGVGRLSPYQSYGNGLRDRGSTYRTLCVRLCDGYYFPISFSTTRSEFAHDADKCSAACGGEARLFYHANPGGEVETMVDLAGMGYAELSTAFKYRKTLVKGCTCRPQPWTEAEAARHRTYTAEQQTAALPGAGDSGAGVHTGDAPDQRQASGFNEPLVVERPEPVSRYTLPSQPRSTFGGSAPRSPFSSKRGSPGSFFR
jgi:Protein of unknown function (DUF2865)